MEHSVWEVNRFVKSWNSISEIENFLVKDETMVWIFGIRLAVTSK